MSRIYVSGPVTGKPDGNKDAFRAARKALKKAGYRADIPHDIVAPWDDRERAMTKCLRLITAPVAPSLPADCYPCLYKGLALLPGWEQSEGARLEKAVAEACGIECRPLADWLGEAL